MRSLTRRQAGVAAAVLGAVASLIGTASAEVQEIPNASVPPNAEQTKVTVNRSGHILLVGLNRPDRGNKVDPEMHRLLSKAYFEYEQDNGLRALVLYGYGDNFCQGIDVEAFAPVIRSRADETLAGDAIDPWAKQGPRLTKPVVVAVHGETFNVGHELALACDIRIAASDTKFANTENVHARMPASGATIRFVREAGWARAMRYLLTGDSFSAQEAYRLGTVQEVCPDAKAAYAKAVEIATKIASCAPLSIKATMVSAQLAIDEGEPKAFAQLLSQRGALYETNDFKEGLEAAKAGRAPIYQGN